MTEGELIAEAVCDAVEEIPWRKVAERVQAACGYGCHKNFIGGDEQAALCRESG